MVTVGLGIAGISEKTSLAFDENKRWTGGEKSWNDWEWEWKKQTFFVKRSFLTQSIHELSLSHPVVVHEFSPTFTY